MPKKIFESTDWIADPGYDEPDMPGDGSQRVVGIRILVGWLAVVAAAAALLLAPMFA